ncbi:MAG: hypothetical protein U1F35_10035 [Steroidobacteraceae bacterium]
MFQAKLEEALPATLAELLDETAAGPLDLAGRLVVPVNPHPSVVEAGLSGAASSQLISWIMPMLMNVS